MLIPCYLKQKCIINMKWVNNFNMEENYKGIKNDKVSYVYKILVKYTFKKCKSFV